MKVWHVQLRIINVALFTATVTTAPDLINVLSTDTPVPTGSVQLVFGHLRGAAGSFVPLSGGVASLPYTPPLSVEIQLNYTGDSNYIALTAGAPVDSSINVYVLAADAQLMSDAEMAALAAFAGTTVTHSELVHTEFDGASDLVAGGLLPLSVFYMPSNIWLTSRGGLSPYMLANPQSGLSAFDYALESLIAVPGPHGELVLPFSAHWICDIDLDIR